MQALSKAKLKLFRSLNRKKERIKAGLCIVEGEKMVQEAFSSSWEVVAYVCREDVLGKYAAFLEGLDPKLVWITEATTFSQLSSLESPEGVLAIVSFPRRELPEKVQGPGFVLDRLQDPGNVGTILRVADWFGFSTVLYTPGTVDLGNPKTLRSSMGAIFRVSTYPIPSLEQFLSGHGKVCWLADMAGTPLPEVTMGKEDFIILGNEANGLSETLLNRFSSNQVAIPGGGGAESLNVAMAAGILAYDLHTRGT